MNENSSRLFIIIVLVLAGVGLFLAGALLSPTMPMMGMMGLCGGTGQGMMDQGHMHEGNDAADDGRDVAARHHASRPSGARKPRSKSAEHLLLSMSQFAQPTNAHGRRLATRSRPDARSGADDGRNARHDDASQRPNLTGGRDPHAVSQNSRSAGIGFRDGARTRHRGRGSLSAGLFAMPCTP